MRGVDLDERKTVFNRGEAGAMISALSFSEEGRGLVAGLEEVRFFHNDARVIDLGRGGVLVTAVEQEWYGSADVATVLIPSRRDSLELRTADCAGRAVPAALFWPRRAVAPVLIPLVLAQRAARAPVGAGVVVVGNLGPVRVIVRATRAARPCAWCWYVESAPAPSYRALPTMGRGARAQQPGGGAPLLHFLVPCGSPPPFRFATPDADPQ